MSAFVLAIVVLLGFVSTSLLGQELTPPSGWTVRAGDGRFVLEPGNLKPGERVTVELFDSAAPSGDLASFFQAQLQNSSEADRSGCKPRQQPNEVSCVVSDRTSGDRYFHAFKTKDGQYRFMTMLMVPNSLGAMRHLLAIKRITEDAVGNVGRAGSGEVAAAPTDAVPPQAAATTPATADASSPVPASAPAPAVAVDPSFPVPMEAIYLHQEYGYGVGGMMTIEYKPHIFLKDGTVTTDLAYYPASAADMQTWRNRRPQSWGRWQKTDGKIVITWNDPKRKPSTWNKWFVARPGAPSQRLEGFYQALGGGGNTAMGGDVMIAAWNDYAFSADGTVTSGGGSGSYSGGQHTDVSVATRSRKAVRTGRYSMNGHAIDFAYADGEQERKWFYLYPDGHKVIGVGASTYVLKKRKD
ncbi:MAG: hypothetical protein KIS79_00910 [Burkholderiales bacterium]|nr:hypothetical protein [Burkholderiales bacterium]